MRLGYISSGLTGLTFAQKVGLCQELGLPVMEVHVREFAPDDDGRALRDLAAAAGVQVTSMGLGLNLTDPARRDETLALLDRALQVARGLGVDYGMTLTRNPQPGVPQKETWAYCARFTRELVQRAADGGLRFGLEVDPPPNFVHNLERVEKLLDAVGHPNLYVNFDPTNFYVVGSDPLTVIARLGHLMVNGHLKDGVYRTDEKGERPVGQGEVPYAEIFPALAARGLDLSMHVEHCRAPEGVIEGVRQIRAVLAGMHSA